MRPRYNFDRVITLIRCQDTPYASSRLIRGSPNIEFLAVE